MKKFLAALAVLVTALAVGLAARPAFAASGFTVSGTRILDATGTEFVMRGVNHPHAWYTSRTPQALADIKARGANTVRVVLGSGQRWGPTTAAEITTLIGQCKANRLICVLEAHDTTGYGEQAGAATLDQAVDYWISVKSALAGQEAYVILNIGNEPYGNTNATAWTAATTSAITRLRAAGFEHSIMVDAPNWGQDWQFVMRDNAAAVFAADPRRNTIFSIHMYGVFDTAAEVTDYLGRFRSAGLPLVIGEFGNLHSDGDPDENAIMATAQQLGVGYLGWSWSGNGGGVEYLDLVTNFDGTALTSWGQRLFTGANGIASTSREAAVFGGSPSSPTPSNPPPASSCAAALSVNSWGGGFVATVKVTAGATALTGWRASVTLPSGTAVTNTWGATAGSSSGTVQFTNVAYNGRLAAGASTEFGFQGTGSAPSAAPSCAGIS
ncbi:cellulase family glycosylhydrolase [Symbioplanes lichenis]|uniref:cellulase family glycosylhydrolase n=1 Tax=Symbioplanes lichenis TaxID=1629072 RepID=UPI002739675B|nr:cellulase family glycosylhydrolase [Actinoplanes lichenis]